MAVIDPTTNLGLCRLRCGDFGDLSLLPDAVYAQALADSGDNVRQASLTCAMYILASLSQSTHRRLATIEVWGSEKYKQYKDYLMLLSKDPSFNGTCPIPYSGSSVGEKSDIVQFQEDWKNNYTTLRQGQQMYLDAQNNPFTDIPG